MKKGSRFAATKKQPSNNDCNDPDGGIPCPIDIEADGLTVKSPAEAVQGATIIAVLTPDMVQKSLYESIVDDIDSNATLLFAHGFAVHFGQVDPREDLNVVLIAPKGPGGLVRRQFDVVLCLDCAGQ